MQYGLTLVTAPAVAAISLTEAKAHLKVTDTAEDTLITTLITAAIEHTERTRALALVEQTWDLTLDCFPAEIEIPLRPVLSITSIVYTDADGATPTLAASEYTLDTKSFIARLYPAYGKSWPTPRDQKNAVTVKFKAGYGAAAADVPERVKAALKFLVGHLFENREMTSAIEIKQLPMAYDALLATESRVRV